MSRLTLTQTSINQIKVNLSIKEDRLIEDISDKEIFDLVNDMHETEDGFSGDNWNYELANMSRQEWVSFLTYSN